MRRKAPAIALAAYLILAQIAYAAPLPEQIKVVGYTWILAPAVTETEKGLEGTVTNVTVLVTEGWGDVYVSTYSLTQEDFQGAATAAARVACSILGLNFSRFNFYFKVEGDAVVVGGPSAGAAMAVAVYSALSGKPINRSVMITGMLSPDGTIGPVGGVFEKAQAAAAQGAKVFLVPPGQSIVVTYRSVVKRVGPFRFYTTERVVVNLTEYAERKWRLKVVEVATIAEVLRYFFGVEIYENTTRVYTLTPQALAIISHVRKAMLFKAENELENAQSYVNSSDLNRLFKAYVERYLEEAEKLLNASLSERGLASVHLSTASTAISKWVKLLVTYYSKRSLESMVRNVSRRISELSMKVERCSPGNFRDANRLVIAADLIIRAIRLYNESATRWSSDPSSALRRLAYSSAFLDEAELWLKGLKEEEGGKRKSQLARTLISVARTTWSYAYSVLSRAGAGLSLIDLAGEYYRLATSMYSRGYGLLAAVAAAKSVAISEAALLYLQAAYSGSDVYLKISRKNALMVASSASDMIASAYYLNYSATAGSVEEKLVWLRHAAQLGSLTIETWGELHLKNREADTSQEANTGESASERHEKEQRKESTSWLEEILRYLSNLLRLLKELLKYIFGA